MIKILKPFSFIPALMLMYIIFSFSAQTGTESSQISYKVSYKLVEAGNYILDTNLDSSQMDEWATKIHPITRKLAHFSVYLALAVAVSFPLYVYGLRGILLMLVAGMVCVGYAIGDEYHQSTVAGRGPSWRDVGIDSAGAFLGIILTRIVGWTGRKTIFRPWDKEAQQDKAERKARKAAKLQEKEYKRLKRNYKDNQNPGNYSQNDQFYGYSPNHNPPIRDYTPNCPRQPEGYAPNYGQTPQGYAPNYRQPAREYVPGYSESFPGNYQNGYQMPPNHEHSNAYTSQDYNLEEVPDDFLNVENFDHRDL